MRTEQQETIVSYIKSNNEPKLVLVSSCAGSGKTFILTEIANEVPHNNGLYMAYNKAIAVESRKKFPSTVNCLTTHSLAYKAVIAPNKNTYSLTANFTYRDINEKIPYEIKCYISDLIKQFCLSKYTSFHEFANDEKVPEKDASIALKYLDLMQEGKIDITHEFYLKMFHILLDAKQIEYDDFDFIMLDEAGDLNEVTLEIFKLLPSKLKIAVGDPHQNIYSFNHTINCFEVLKDQGRLFNMSQSFRVNKNIATNIETFCKNFIDPNMEFKGVDTDNNIKTRAFISRTNAALIAKMIELNSEGVPYSLIRKAKEIFKLPLILASIKPHSYISDPQYKYLQGFIDDWYSDPLLKVDYKSPLHYISSMENDDVQLSQAINLLLKYGKSMIFDTYKEAAKHESVKNNLILTTSHSAKGLEMDEVVISNDLNDSMLKAIDYVREGHLTTECKAYKDIANLYYVAVTRAKKSLVNANCLYINNGVL